MLNLRRLLRPTLLFGALLLPLAPLSLSCGGGGGDGETGDIDILIGDAPADELLAFRATINALRLVRIDGAVSSDLIITPVDVELIGLSSSLEWLSSLDVAPGTYTGMLLGFEAGSYEATAPDGSDVAVTASSNVLAVEFPSPVVVAGDSYKRFSIDVDLAESLSGDIASPPLMFDPLGTISDDSSVVGPIAIDEMKGLVKGASSTNGTVLIQAYVDDDLDIALKLVTVDVAPGTLLVDDDGTTFASQAAFFAALTADQTVLEVHGGLDESGHVIATKLEVDDQAGGSGSANKVRIEGLVLDFDADSFELAIAEIEQGSAIAAPVLSTLGNPGVITVGFDSGTSFFLNSDTPTTSATLALGQKVDVRFVTFTNEPFPASKVEIESEGAEFEGIISSVSGIPADFEMHLYSSSHWIPDTVAASSTDVTVDVTGSTFVVQTKNNPVIAGSDLINGLKVEVEGSPTGGSTPTVPVIDASKVKVKAGRFEGVVSDVDAVAGTLTVVGTVEQTFGLGVSNGTVMFDIEPDCVIEGDVDTATELQQLFDGLDEGESVDIRVEGIGSGTNGEARAFYVRAELDD